MKPSTRAFFKLHGWRHPFRFLHGYIYGKWINTYLSVITGKTFKGRKRKTGVSPSAPRPIRPQTAMGRWFEERYHSKVLTHEDAGKIVKLSKALRVDNPERVVPYEIANQIILDTPGSLAVMRCPCREIKGDDRCGPLEVCMVVGKPFVDFVVEHGTNGARKIDRAEGIKILEKARDSGWVHTAWFKDAMAGRFYAICNCCSCCCGAMNAHRNGTPMLASSGYVGVVDPDLCGACGLCVEYCQFGAISLDNGYAAVNAATCMGCGVCVSKCPQEAFSLVLDPSRGEPLEIQKLMDSAERAAQN